MIIGDDRAELDAALGKRVSICVLVGAETADAGKVHAFLDKKGWGDEPWNRWFLVTNADKITSDERTAWFGGNAVKDYAFLGRKTKASASSGPAGDLLDGEDCDYMECIKKFAEADKK